MNEPPSNADTPEGTRDEGKPPTTVKCNEGTPDTQSTEAKGSQKGKNWPQRIEAVCAVALVFITGFYTYYAKKQRDASLTANATAQTAIDQARVQFRQDERPYVALQPAGAHGRAELVKRGEHSGHFVVEIHLANYGRSPAIEIGRDARLAIGSEAGKEIKLHAAVDQRGRIIPPGDHPSIFAYSDDPIGPDEFRKIMTAKRLVIFYGHIDYTDLLSEPRPMYKTEFCTGILTTFNGADEANEDCKAHTYMK